MFSNIEHVMDIKSLKPFIITYNFQTMIPAKRTFVNGNFNNFIRISCKFFRDANMIIDHCNIGLNSDIVTKTQNPGFPEQISVHLIDAYRYKSITHLQYNQPCVYEK